VSTSSPLSISTVIPTHDRAGVVGRAAASALAQCIPGDEVIVVDDGSRDGTEQALAPLRERIRYLRVEHGGAGAARNAGIRAARGDLVAFLDSDDEWLPGRLELARRLLRARPDVLFCFSDFRVRDADENEHRRFLYRWHEDPRPWSEILGPSRAFSELADLPPGLLDFPVHVGSLYAAEARRGYVFTSTVAARRVEAGDALRFAEDVPTREDLECFGRLAGRGAGAFLDVETAVQHGGAAARLSETAPLQAAEASLRILERVWGSDPEFLKHHGAVYREAAEEQRRIRCAALLHRGDVAPARAELRRMDAPPLLFRGLALLPGRVVRGVLRLRQALGLTGA
jgi:hypothetical protein